MVERNRRKVHLAGRDAIALGASRNLFADFYHGCMTVSWPVFMASALLVFLVVNFIFAGLFALQTGSVGNLPDGKPWHVIYFSIETLATVGYGDMHPETDYAHVVASCETFVGLLFSAVLTGLIFARFARPRVRILASDAIVLGQHDGQPTLMLRVANERLNTISDATARLWLLHDEVTAEGQKFRRVEELNLVRNNQPLFILTWMIFHHLDERSPLYGLTAEDYVARNIGFVLMIVGNDESITQEIRSRHLYTHEQVLRGHQFVDVLRTNAAGVLEINYEYFNQTVPQTLNAPSESNA
ncbi:MAG: ion channel [Formosimonas sp.]